MDQDMIEFLQANVPFSRNKVSLFRLWMIFLCLERWKGKHDAHVIPAAVWLKIIDAKLNALKRGIPFWKTGDHFYMAEWKRYIQIYINIHFLVSVLKSHQFAALIEQYILKFLWPAYHSKSSSYCYSKWENVFQIRQSHFGDRQGQVYPKIFISKTFWVKGPQLSDYKNYNHNLEFMTLGCCRLLTPLFYRKQNYLFVTT